MSFLSKHYEKIILAAFLLVFIVSLIYLIMVFSKSTEITEKDLTLIRRQADYQSKFDEVGKETAAKEKDRHYADLENLGKAQSWIKTVNSNPNSPVSTDLLDPIPAARCPNPDRCGKIIPLIYFKPDGKCILCGYPLKKPEAPPDPGGGDKDGDGMPDDWERQHDLNPELASDKMEDKDEDSFPNLVEYQAKPQTKPNDAESHPPMAWRLSLVGVKKTKLPLQLINVMKNGSEDKEKWLVQLKVLDKRGRWKSEFLKLGATLQLLKDIYKIKEINFKEEEKFDPRLRQPVKTNISEIIIQNTVNEADKPITVEMKKPVYENLVKIMLKDDITEKTDSVKIGDSLTIGKEKYQVISLDGKKSVTIKDITDGKKDGKDFVIQAKSILNQTIEKITGEEEARTEKGPMGAPDKDPRKMPPGRLMPPPSRFGPR